MLNVVFEMLPGICHLMSARCAVRIRPPPVNNTSAGGVEFWVEMCHRFIGQTGPMRDTTNRGRIAFAIGLLFIWPNQTKAASSAGYQIVNAFGTTSFTQPVCLRTPPGETNRVFVLEKTGLIQVLTN